MKAHEFKHITQHRITCLGSEINYIDLGEGEPILFLHNGGGFWQSWIKQVQYYSRTNRVIALDWPSFGNSGISNEKVELGYLVSILDDFIEQFGFNSVILIANCIGASAAYVFADRSPEKVQKLVLFNICPGNLLFTHRLGQCYLNMLEHAPLVRNLSRPLLSFLFAKTPLKKQFPAVNFGQEYSKETDLYKYYEERLKTRKHTRTRIDLLYEANSFSVDRFYRAPLQVPVISFWGGENKVCNVATGYHLNAELGLELIEVPGSGHLCMYESPDFIHPRIDAFLSQGKQITE